MKEEPPILMTWDEANPMRLQHEVATAHAVVANQEKQQFQNKDMASPQVHAFTMGMRCALAWVLGLKRGGRKLEELLKAGTPLHATLPTLPSETFREKGTV